MGTSLHRTSRLLTWLILIIICFSCSSDDDAPDRIINVQVGEWSNSWSLFTVRYNNGQGLDNYILYVECQEGRDVQISVPRMPGQYTPVDDNVYMHLELGQFGRPVCSGMQIYPAEEDYGFLNVRLMDNNVLSGEFSFKAIDDDSQEHFVEGSFRFSKWNDQ